MALTTSTLGIIAIVNLCNKLAAPSFKRSKYWKLGPYFLHRNGRLMVDRGYPRLLTVLPVDRMYISSITVVYYGSH